jgi:hypothetical protein
MKNDYPAAEYRIGIIANTAFSLINFRGPLIEEMVRRGMTVFAFAPDYDASARAAVRSLGATPHHIYFSRAGKNPITHQIDQVKLSFPQRNHKQDTSVV